jgi:hypothetical protein
MKIEYKQPKSQKGIVVRILGIALGLSAGMFLLIYIGDTLFKSRWAMALLPVLLLLITAFFAARMFKGQLVSCTMEIRREGLLRTEIPGGAPERIGWDEVKKVKSGVYRYGSLQKYYLWIWFTSAGSAFIERGLPGEGKASELEAFMKEFEKYCTLR